MKREYILLPAAFITNAGIGILNFSLVFYMRDIFSSSPAEIGWMSSIWALSYLAGCSLLHRLSRRIGAHWSITAGIAGMTLAVLGMIQAVSAYQVFILYGVFGFLTAMFWPPLMGWLSEGAEGLYLNRMIGYFNISWSTGLVLSPYIAGLLIESNLVYPLFFALFILGVLEVFLIAFILLFPGVKPEKDVSESRETGTDSSTPLRFTAWLGNYTAYFIFGILIFVFPIYAREQLEFSESSIGLLLLFRALLSTFVFILAGRISWWHFKKSFALSMQAVLIGFILILPIVKNWSVFVFWFSIFGVIFAVQYSSSIFHGVSGSINREKRMAIHESVLTMGIITGAIGGGEIYQRFGMTAVFRAAAFAAVIVFAVQIIILIKTKAGIYR